MAYERKEHNLSDDIREQQQAFYVAANMDITKSLRFNASYAHGKIKNLDALSDNDENINTFMVQLRYEF